MARRHVPGPPSSIGRRIAAARPRDRQSNPCWTSSDARTVPDPAPSRRPERPGPPGRGTGRARDQDRRRLRQGEGRRRSARTSPPARGSSAAATSRSRRSRPRSSRPGPRSTRPTRRPSPAPRPSATRRSPTPRSGSRSRARPPTSRSRRPAGRPGPSSTPTWTRSTRSPSSSSAGSTSRWPHFDEVKAAAAALRRHLQAVHRRRPRPPSRPRSARPRTRSPSSTRRPTGSPRTTWCASKLKILPIVKLDFFIFLCVVLFLVAGHRPRAWSLGWMIGPAVALVATLVDRLRGPPVDRRGGPQADHRGRRPDGHGPRRRRAPRRPLGRLGRGERQAAQGRGRAPPRRPEQEGRRHPRPS